MKISPLTGTLPIDLELIYQDMCEQFPEEARHLRHALEQHSFLAPLLGEFLQAFHLLEQGFRAGKTLYLCGNGGSFSDCIHIAGELMKTFKLPRPLNTDEQNAFVGLAHGDLLAEHLQKGLPCMVLGLNPSLSSAILNDSKASGMQYAQELYCLGRPGDVLLAISTSGNAQNVLLAVSTAKALGMTVIGLTGRMGGLLTQMADISLNVTESETYKIQEQHVIVYHLLCLLLESRFFLSPSLPACYTN